MSAPIADQTSVVATINDAIKQYVAGTSLIYGLVREKSLQDKVVNCVADEVVAINDTYDNLFFHKVTGEPSYEALRFTNRKTTTIELFCYVTDGCVFDTLEDVFAQLQNDNVLLELKSNNQDALDVLRRGFLIADPETNNGYNQEKYVFSFTYEAYSYASQLCC